MKKYILTGVVIGLILGIGQIFYTKQVSRPTPPFDMTNVMPCEQKVPGCGYCPEDQKEGSLCHLPPYQQRVRGWPLTHDTYDSLSRYDKSPTLLLNAIIILGGIITVSMLVGLILSRQKK